MTSSNGNIFRVTGPLCREFTGHQWNPCTKASDAELLCFLWSAPWINSCVNNREAGDLRRQRAHYDVIVMVTENVEQIWVAKKPVWDGCDWLSQSMIKGAWLANAFQPCQHPVHDWVTQIWACSSFHGNPLILMAGNGFRSFLV